MKFCKEMNYANGVCQHKIMHCKRYSSHGKLKMIIIIQIDIISWAIAGEMFFSVASSYLKERSMRKIINNQLFYIFTLGSRIKLCSAFALSIVLNKIAFVSSDDWIIRNLKQFVLCRSSFLEQADSTLTCACLLEHQFN